MPNVFVSYSHDSAEHEDRVLRLANALRGHGVNVELDRYHLRPPQGWPRWCEEQLRPESSDFVLMICTDTYLKRVENRVPVEVGRGAFWEGDLIYNYLYQHKSNTRFIPILLSGATPDDIPIPVRDDQHYRIDAVDLSDPGYKALYRELTGQPEVTKPPLGSVVPLPGLALLAPLPTRSALALLPSTSGDGVVFTLELDAQLRMTGAEPELLVALDELLLKSEKGEQVSVRVIEPEIAAARDELASLGRLEHPTIEERGRVVFLERRLRGRVHDEPPFDQLLGEVMTTLLTQVVPRVGAVYGAKAALECMAEILRWYAVPNAAEGVAIDCFVRQNGWALKVELEKSIVDTVAADIVGGFEWLRLDNSPVYISDFPADSIRLSFVPQLLTGYFQLKYWSNPPVVPDIAEVFTFSRVRVGRH